MPLRRSNVCRKCFVPWYNKSNMEMCQVLSVEALTKLPMTKWGIRQPLCTGTLHVPPHVAQPPTATPSPCATRAWTSSSYRAWRSPRYRLYRGKPVRNAQHGDRLGHGMGYYDKYLDRCRAHARERTCGSRPSLSARPPVVCFHLYHSC
jgi:hypothetical protein